MKNWIQSPWFLILFAGLVYFGSTGSALYLSRDLWLPVPAVVASEIPESEVEVERHLGFNAQSMELLAESLESRKRGMEAREKQLHALEQTLEKERYQLQEVRQELEARGSQIEALFHRIKQEEVAQLKKLAGIYEKMEPEMVVEVLEEFTDDKIVKVLQLMDVETVRTLFETMMARPQDSGEAANRVAFLSQQLTRTFSPDGNEG